MLTLALILMVLMGGILAYTGDLIGRRFGKKRVTLFGLRPRYTAILITSVTGILIAGSTMGTLYVLVPNVREVINEGERAIAELPKVTANLQAAKTQESVAIQRADQANKLAESSKQELAGVTKELQKKNSELAAGVKRLRAVQSRLSVAQGQLASTKATNSRLSAANERLTTANDALASNNIKLAGENAKLQESNITLAKANAEMQKKNTELAHLNGELEQVNNERSARNIELTRQNESLDREAGVKTRVIKELRRQTETLQAEKAEAQKENDRLKTDNSRLASENSSLKSLFSGYTSLSEAYQAARMKRVAVHKDEDLARIVIPAGLPPEKVQEYIQSLIQDASEAAKTRGASSGDGFKAVKVVKREVLSQGPDGQLRTDEISGDSRIDAVVSKLSWQTAPCVVLAIAVTNSVEEEPAGIDLQPLPNRRVFQKGQVVFGRSVNGGQSPTGIFNDMVKFLKEMGHSALEQGVIPRMDPLTGEPEVGAMNAGGVVDLVEKIRAVGGRVRVRAVAEEDLYSADPLKVRFEVLH
jgi:uncharacterized protein (DUF3084 family)